MNDKKIAEYYLKGCEMGRYAYIMDLEHCDIDDSGRGHCIRCIMNKVCILTFKNENSSIEISENNNYPRDEIQMRESANKYLQQMNLEMKENTNNINNNNNNENYINNTNYIY